MFRFEKYEDSLEEQWDKFIAEKSINGTFLQSRRFFNYHPAGRFKDVSLVVYNEKNNIAALIPACELEQDGKKVFFSHHLWRYHYRQEASQCQTYSGISRRIKGLS